MQYSRAHNKTSRPILWRCNNPKRRIRAIAFVSYGPLVLVQTS